MKSFRIFILVLLLSPISESFAEFDGTYWIVRRGDTLYAIARAVYPDNARQQARLRKDIIKLNQNVFAAGGRSLFIGLKLHMPSYVTAAIKSGIQKPVVKKPEVKRPGKKSAVKPVTSARLVSGNQWKIKRGDTLYSIGRYFFPKSNRQQYKLRKEIVSLNPDVFGPARGRLEIGMLLTLPDYLVKKESQPKVVVPVQPPVRPQVVTPTVSKPQPPVKQTVTKPETRTDQRQPVVQEKPKTDRRASISDYEGFYSVSIGYSVGGDDALIASGGHDITFGGGAHIRFNYDGLWDNRQGFRIALGTQLDQVTADNDDSGELSQKYLQSLYIYNLSSSLIGIGLAYHDNIVFESDISGVITTFEPDGTAGIAVIYEYKRLFGKHILGVSHTSLETEDSSGGPIDMSRTEIYYRWQF